MRGVSRYDFSAPGVIVHQGDALGAGRLASRSQNRRSPAGPWPAAPSPS